MKDTIAALERARARRDEASRKLAEIDSEIKELVIEGFAKGLTAPTMALAVGLSAPRLYQIRDGRR